MIALALRRIPWDGANLSRAIAGLAMVFAVASFVRVSWPEPTPDGLSPAARTEIQLLVRDLVSRDPNILLDALRFAQSQATNQRQASAQSIVRNYAGALFDDADAPAIGATAPAVTLVEFLDYQCGFCRRAHPGLEKLLAENPDVRLVTKQIPILGPASLYAARAAFAADRLGTFPAFHTAVMDSRVPLNEDVVLRLAERSGIDRAALLAELASGQHADRQSLTRNGELARNLGITGTPAFVIGDTVLRGLPDMATLRTLIDQARPES